MGKAAVQAAFGRVPGGVAAYDAATRDSMGTAASHVAKLARVWPGYARSWTEELGIELEGARIWVHEAGATPFCPLAAFMLTGNAGVSTVSRGSIRSQYLARALDGVLSCDWPGAEASSRRRAGLEGLRWEPSVDAAIQRLGGRVHRGSASAGLPWPDASVDLCHSGGALEHLRPDALARFLVESRRVVRPGGWLSHVVDHRDHLHHADRGLPFANHLAYSDRVYEALFGHGLGYHNRMSPRELVEAFERAGFELVQLRRLVYPSRRYVQAAASAGVPGLPRRRLARRFRDISDEDLATAAGHYLLRRIS